MTGCPDVPAVNMGMDPMGGKWLAAGCITEIMLKMFEYVVWFAGFFGQRDEASALDQRPENTGASFVDSQLSAALQRCSGAQRCGAPSWAESMRGRQAHALQQRPTLQLSFEALSKEVSFGFVMMRGYYDRP